MAKLPDGIFGGFRGRIGNIVGVVRNGTHYIRTAPAQVTNPGLLKNSVVSLNMAPNLSPSTPDYSLFRESL